MHAIVLAPFGLEAPIAVVCSGSKQSPCSQTLHRSAFPTPLRKRTHLPSQRLPGCAFHLSFAQSMIGLCTRCCFGTVEWVLLAGIALFANSKGTFCCLMGSIRHSHRFCRSLWRLGSRLRSRISLPLLDWMPRQILRASDGPNWFCYRSSSHRLLSYTLNRS